MKLLAILSLVACALTNPSEAGAEEPTEPARVADLRVRALPVPTPASLYMRAVVAPPISVPTVGASRIAAQSGSGDDAIVADADTSFRVVPNDWRDIQERVIFKVNLGYGLDAGQVSGDVGKNGFDPTEVTDVRANGFDDQRQYLLGDAILGTRGILMPSLNTYFLSRYALAADGASQFAALNSVYDQRGGRALLVRSGYAEIDDLTDDESFLGRLFLRAGRQFRYGASTFVTNFDGVSAGIDSPGYEVSGFFGRRVSNYFADDPGLLGGARIKLRGGEAIGVPLDFAVDYLFFDGGGPADSALEDADINLARQYIEISARSAFGGTRIYVRGRLVDNGELRVDGDGEKEGLGLGRLSAQLRQPIGKKLMIVGEVQQKFAREAAYDYINPAPNDVLNIAETIGIGLDAPQDATLASLRASFMLSRALEVYGFGRANIVSGDSNSGFNRSWQEGGIAVGHRLGRKLWSTAQYKLRLTNLDDDANGEGTEFENHSGSGVTQFHEVSGDVRYSFGYKKMSAAVGAYYRVYDLQSSYSEVADDGRGGARADADYWINKYLRAKVAGEFAQASSVFAPELGNLFSIRLLMEALF